MASSVPLPDLEKHRRMQKSKQHGSHLCNLVNGTDGDLGEGRTEVGCGGSKTSDFLPEVKHPLRYTHEPLESTKASDFRRFIPKIGGIWVLRELPNGITKGQ